ncbi:MAG: YCF48-related protein [Cycloclasticus sp.]
MKEILTRVGKSVFMLGAILSVALLATSAFAEEQGDTEKPFHRFWPDNLYAVEFVNDKLGFVAGYSGSLFRTQDGGESWDGIYLGVNELVRHVSFVDENNGWAVGHRGSILHTSDGGTTWVVQMKDEANYLRDVSFFDANNGWAVGHTGHIWHTSNGGESWEAQELTGYTGRDLPRLHGVVAKDANTAIVIGEFGVIAHTEDAGKLWSISYNSEKNTLLSMAATQNGAIAVGLDGGIYQILLSSDEQRAEIKAIQLAEQAEAEAKARKKAERRRRTYVPKVVEELPETEIDYYVSKIESGTKEHLYDVSSSSDGSVIAVGVSSVLKISGNTVTPLSAAKDFPLPFVWMGGVDVTPSGDLWAAGLRGMIVKGNVNDMNFGAKLNIAAPGAVKLISSRWGEK